MMFDATDISLTHIATGPLDACFLPLAQEIIEEQINGLTAFTLADPQDTSAIQIVDDGGEFAALAIGDLIDTHRLQASDLMPIAHPIDDSVQQIGKGRLCHLQDLSSGLLGHDLAQGAESPLQTAGDTRIGGSPWDRLLCNPVRRALNLLRCIPEKNLQAHEGDIFPPAKRGGMAHDPAAPLE